MPTCLHRPIKIRKNTIDFWGRRFDSWFGQSMMPNRISASSILCCLLLGACGTVTPDFQEFWAVDAANTQQKIVNISAQVSCELQKAIEQLVEQDKKISKRYSTPRKTEWIEKWGVQMTLTLNVVEKTGLTPGLSLNTPFRTASNLFAGQNVTTPQSFNLGLAGEASSTATRTGIVHVFYTVQDLLKGPPAGTTCIPSQAAEGYLFIESDLKLKEWLFAAASPSFVGLASFPASKDNGPLGQDTISHEVKFQVVTNGSINPSWKLVDISANTSPSLMGISRDRYQDLLVTLGPLDKTFSGRTVLAPSAEGIHQAQQIGLFVSSALR